MLHITLPKAIEIYVLTSVLKSLPDKRSSNISTIGSGDMHTNRPLVKSGSDLTPRTWKGGSLLPQGKIGRISSTFLNYPRINKN